MFTLCPNSTAPMNMLVSSNLRTDAFRVIKPVLRTLLESEYPKFQTNKKIQLQLIGSVNCVRRTICVKANFSNREGGSNASKQNSIQLYSQIERVFTNAAQSSDTVPGRWENIQGCWVLRPPNGPATAVVHFIGGAFVGASPHLTYRLFLETLSARGGYIIVTTPFATAFDHSRIADEAQFKFDACLRIMAEQQPQMRSLPVYGVGHSLGALTHLLIGSRYAVERRANVLLSFNNKALKDAVPLLSAGVLPAGTQQLAPLLKQLAQFSPAMTSTAKLLLQRLQALNPGLVADVMPLVEQLPLLYREMEQGAQEFKPSPQETKALVASYYGVRHNMLVQFSNDSIDESAELASLLAGSANAADEVVLKTLPGDHARPLQQTLPGMPTKVADAIAQGSALFAAFAGSSPLAGMMAKGVEWPMDTSALTEQTKQDMDKLVDTVVEWMESPKASRATKLLT